MRHRRLLARLLVAIAVPATLLTVTVTGTTAATAASTKAASRPRSRAVVNQAVSVDAQTGAHTARLAWMVRTNTGGALPSNYAKAQTWCDDCRTTAIAVQIVLMSNVTGPTANWNHSVAANSRCARCATAAAAFQFSVISNGTVVLTPSGAAQLAGLRAEMQAIAASTDAPAEVNAAATTIASRVLGVLQREVRVAGAAPAAHGFRLLAGAAPVAIRFQHDTDAASN